MAADTRPYKSKEQDGQGNEVIIRDQQLVEQSTVTTMPSGACFETLDIDGRPVKIPRDNMMSIVLECIGIVLNDSSKNLGTNVNKALGLQGNTIGNVTLNDFASVLGVQSAVCYTELASSDNLNNCRNGLFHYTVSNPSSPNFPVNTPASGLSTESDFILSAVKIGNITIQSLHFIGASFFRYGYAMSNWSAWAKISIAYQ